MQETSQSKITKKITVLISVVAFMLAGWLAGHILRFSIPEILHPPIEQFTPQIQNGFESKGIRCEIVLSGVGILTSDGATTMGEFVFGSCAGNMYYTSLPAKCRSVSGELVQVGGTELERYFISPRK